jgi:hypothetical protein
VKSSKPFKAMGMWSSDGSLIIVTRVISEAIVAVFGFALLRVALKPRTVEPKLLN